MMLRLLQKSGGKPIVLMGGGTTRIGDPSGKDEARALLTDEKIASNMAGIRKVFDQYRYGEIPQHHLSPLTIMNSRKDPSRAPSHDHCAMYLYHFAPRVLGRSRPPHSGWLLVESLPDFTTKGEPNATTRSHPNPSR